MKMLILALVSLSIAACSSATEEDEVVLSPDTASVAPQQKAVATACCAGVSNQYTSSCGQNTDKGHCNGLNRCMWTCTFNAQQATVASP